MKQIKGGRTMDKIKLLQQFDEVMKQCKQQNKRLDNLIVNLKILQKELEAMTPCKQ